MSTFGYINRGVKRRCQKQTSKAKEEDLLRSLATHLTVALVGLLIMTTVVSAVVKPVAKSVVSTGAVMHGLAIKRKRAERYAIDHRISALNRSLGCTSPFNTHFRDWFNTHSGCLQTDDCVFRVDNKERAASFKTRIWRTVYTLL